MRRALIGDLFTFSHPVVTAQKLFNILQTLSSEYRDRPGISEPLWTNMKLLRLETQSRGQMSLRIFVINENRFLPTERDVILFSGKMRIRVRENHCCKKTSAFG